MYSRDNRAARDTTRALNTLGPVIDAASRKALHKEQCGCDRGMKCPHWPHLYTASAEETLRWLFDRCILDISRVERYLRLTSNPNKSDTEEQ